MGKTDSQTAQQELVAFHAALLRSQAEAGDLGRLIPVPDWEGLLVRCLGTMTRQSCQDKTWALSRLGLIVRKERVGVIVLDTRSRTTHATQAIPA